MPVYNPAIKNINIEQLKRYSGLTKNSDFPQQLLEQACIEAHILCHPKAIWQLYDYRKASAAIISSEPFIFSSSAIKTHLASSLKVAVVAITIGPELEEQVRCHFKKDEYTRGLLLDAAGTTAIEMAADQVCEFIKQEVSIKGYTTLSRFSPGYGNWDIRVQPRLLSLSQGRKIEISCTPACMLLPHKSITAVIGLLPYTCINEFKINKKNTACNKCQQLNCLARKDEKNDSYF